MTIDYLTHKRIAYQHHGVCVTYQGAQIGTKTLLALMNYMPESSPDEYETMSTEPVPWARVLKADVDQPRRGDVIYNEDNEAFTVGDYRVYGKRAIEWQIELTADGDG